LVSAFEYQFPEHYGEIIQKALNRMSESQNRILPAVLLDLLNSIYRKSGCQLLYFGMSNATLQEELRYFATNQKLFSFKEIVDTSCLLGQHFQNDRLKNSLNGLFSRHGDFVEVITFWLCSFNHAAVVSALHAYPGALADECTYTEYSEIYNKILCLSFVHSGKLNLAKHIGHVQPVVDPILSQSYVALPFKLDQTSVNRSNLIAME
jgi:hypothetical protein